MIHLRVVSPPDVTVGLVPELRTDPAVMNLTVLPGAVSNPDGDAVQFDVLQGAANEVIGRLRDLELDQRGSIVLENVDTEARSSTLIGVFISVTTIPAAADIGVSLAFGSNSEAWGSTLQLLLNVTVLTAVAIIGLPVQQAIWRRTTRRASAAPPG